MIYKERQNRQKKEDYPAANFFTACLIKMIGLIENSLFLDRCHKCFQCLLENSSSYYPLLFMCL